MENALYKAQDENWLLEIGQDDCCTSPREDYTLGTIVSWSNKYRLGEKQVKLSAGSDVYGILSEFCNIHEDIFLPIYMYDHSGVCIRTVPYVGNYDTYQVGWIYVTREELAEAGLEEKTDKAVEELLRQELKIYDTYLRGDVYYFTLSKKELCSCCGHVGITQEESVGGFYGDDFEGNGMSEYINNEAKHLVAELKRCF